MANDRIFIECRHCHEKKLLYKYYQGMGSYVYPTSGALQEFIDKHLTEQNPGVNLNGNPGFDLATESEAKS